MTFPLEFFENFEAGTRGNFDSESDAGNRLDFPHARDLAPHMPWRGAYCMRVNFTKNNTDAYVQKAVSWAVGQKRHGRFRLYVGEDVQFGNDQDTVRLIQWLNGTPVNEAHLLLGRKDPMGLVLACQSEDGAGSWLLSGYVAVPRGRWITVEWYREIANPTGVVGIWLPDVAFAGAIGPEAANAFMRVGAMSQTGDLQGSILIDEFAVDEDRLYDDGSSAHNGQLSGGSMLLIKSGFAFLGRGEVDQISLIDGGSGNCRAKTYDTDDVTDLPIGSIRESLATLSANAVEQGRRPSRYHRGCYVELSGTNPQALVRLGAVENEGRVA